MTQTQIDLLARIQGLAITGIYRTGYRITHEVRGDTDRHGVYVGSDVRVLDTRNDLEVIHRTSVMIDATGSDEPCRLAADDECTLRDQHDALAAWIEQNRKEEAA